MEDVLLTVTYRESDPMIKIIKPMLESRMKRDLPSIDIQYVAVSEKRDMSFVGVKKGLTVFNLDGLYAPSDIVQKFKNSLSLV